MHCLHFPGPNSPKGSAFNKTVSASACSHRRVGLYARNKTDPPNGTKVSKDFSNSDTHSSQARY